VNWPTDKHAFALAVVVYGAAAVASMRLWRRGFERDDRVGCGLVALGFGLHTLALLARGLSLQRCPVTNIYEVTSFLAWSLALVYLLAGWRRSTRGLGVLAAPILCLVGAAALTPGLDRPAGLAVETHRTLLSLHVTVTLLAYGLFGLAALAGAMFLVRERDLRLGRLRVLLARLPPLQRLENAMRRMMQAGFVLLTMGLVLGGLLPRPAGASLSRDPKVLWAVGLWLLYAALLAGRRCGLSTRRFAWGAAGLFGYTLLTFWATSLASPWHRP